MIHYVIKVSKFPSKISVIENNWENREITTFGVRHIHDSYCIYDSNTITEEL